MMPLTALMQNANVRGQAVCNFTMQYLDTTENQIVLGSMFLQQFTNLWEYNYGADNVNTMTLTM